MQRASLIKSIDAVGRAHEMVNKKSIQTQKEEAQMKQYPKVRKPKSRTIANNNKQTRRAWFSQGQWIAGNHHVADTVLYVVRGLVRRNRKAWHQFRSQHRDIRRALLAGLIVGHADARNLYSSVMGGRALARQDACAKLRRMSRGLV